MRPRRNVGFKGSRKSTPFAAQMAAEQAARRAMEHGVRKADVQVKGPGSAARPHPLIQQAGIEVTGIKDCTPIPHTCRLNKRRRAWRSLFDPAPALGAWAQHLGQGRNHRLDKRPYPPGERRSRRRGWSVSPAAAQEKQKAAATATSVFRNIFRSRCQRPARTCFASSSSATTSSTAGWAATCPQARQFVGHGHVNVNGRVPTFRATDWQGRRRGAASRSPRLHRRTVEPRRPGSHAPGGLDRNEQFQVTVRELPIREQIDIPVREQLIVELYSK